MCDRVARGGTHVAGLLAIVASVALGFVPASGSGQRPSPPGTVERERARTLELQRLWEEAKAAEQRLDSARVRQLPSDTVKVGGFVILAEGDARGPAERAAREAWPAIQKTFGADAPLLVRSTMLMKVIPSTVFGRKGRAVELGVLHGGTLDNSQTAPYEDLNAITIGLRYLASIQLTATLDAHMREWLGGMLNATGAPRGDLEIVHRRLLTGGAAVTDRCFAGDITACREAMGLITPADDVTTWWTPTQRRNIAERYLAGPAERVLQSNCMGGSDNSCIQLLRLLPPPAPLDVVARRVLTQVAIERGGDSAFARLRADSLKNVETRLAAASGMPIEALVREWHSRVVAARPRTVIASPGSILTAVGWITLLGVASVRGSRWR